jgi:hypothetical protein
MREVGQAMMRIALLATLHAISHPNIEVAVGSLGDLGA